MIMGTSSKLNSAFAILFVTANLLNCIKTEEDLSNPNISIPPSLPKTILTSTTSDAAPKIEPLSTRVFNVHALRYLTPELLSQSEPLAYILPKVTGNVYTSATVLEPVHLRVIFESIRNHVNRYLKARKFPRPYVPYAKLLYSIASCLARLNRTAIEIRQFQIKYPNESDYPPLPPGTSNPELRSLFDADIFSDSRIPSVLVQKLVKISSDKIPEVVKNLKKLTNNHTSFQQPYYLYMHFLQIFFEETKDLESLRDEYLELQKLKLKKV